MKSLIIALAALISLQVFAVERVAVGCMNPQVTSARYNVLFDVTYERLNSYTVAVEDQLFEQELITEETEVGPLFVKYGENDETMFGYEVQITKDILNNWKVTPWISTRWIDDYAVIQTADVVECHLLKKAPASMIVDTANISKKLQ